MFRSALVALRPDTSNKPLLDYAVQLAQRYSLHLAGTSILDRDLLSPPEAVPLGGMAFKAELNEARVSRARAQMESTIGEFERHCSAAGVPFDVTSAADALSPQISRAAQRHDVLLLGHTEEQTPSGPRRDSAALQQILQESTGPAIVVPELPLPSYANVAVAYDGSMQSSRALKSFIASGFCQDRPIHVLTFDPELAAAEETASIAAELLQRHGYEVRPRPALLHRGMTADERIEEACGSLGVQLLVMGAYGKPTIREYFLGTVTKWLLARLRIPMFIDN
jgi:nucleotide-binding universal stress UspA family protein